MCQAHLASPVRTDTVRQPVRSCSELYSLPWASAESEVEAARPVSTQASPSRLPRTSSIAQLQCARPIWPALCTQAPLGNICVCVSYHHCQMGCR